MHPTPQNRSLKRQNILFLAFVRPFLLVLCLATMVSAQSQKATAQRPSPTPTPQPDEPLRIFTEEVRLPVMAKDQFGHYDPAVVPEDVLVLEDGIAQQVNSVRHIPANVLIVLDIGGELSGLGGNSKSTSLTREAAATFVNQLAEGPSIAVMQFSGSPELIQTWTKDRKSVFKVLKNKLSTGKRARFSDAVAAAAKLLQDRPEGSRHVIFVTDGVDTPGGKVSRAQAIKQLNGVRATVHIISYTEYVRQQKANRPSSVSVGQLPTSSDPIRATDPTQAGGQNRSPSFGIGVRFDPAMRRQRKAYEAELRNSQQLLTEMAEETGGTIFLPRTAAEMVAQAKEAAREVGSEYVVTYRPKRPLASATPGEYRRIEVASRRVGLSLRSRRGYVVPAHEGK